MFKNVFIRYKREKWVKIIYKKIKKKYYINKSLNIYNPIIPYIIIKTQKKLLHHISIIFYCSG